LPFPNTTNLPSVPSEQRVSVVVPSEQKKEIVQSNVSTEIIEIYKKHYLSVFKKHYSPSDKEKKNLAKLNNKKLVNVKNAFSVLNIFFQIEKDWGRLEEDKDGVHWISEGKKEIDPTLTFWLSVDFQFKKLYSVYLEENNQKLEEEEEQKKRTVLRIKIKKYLSEKEVSFSHLKNTVTGYGFGKNEIDLMSLGLLNKIWKDLDNGYLLKEYEKIIIPTELSVFYPVITKEKDEYNTWTGEEKVDNILNDFLPDDELSISEKEIEDFAIEYCSNL